MRYKNINTHIFHYFCGHSGFLNIFNVVVGEKTAINLGVQISRQDSAFGSFGCITKNYDYCFTLFPVLKAENPLDSSTAKSLLLFLEVRIFMHIIKEILSIASKEHFEF